MGGGLTEKVYTARGTAEHARTDEERHQTSGGRRVETALPVWSDRRGLAGRFDVIEFLSDLDGALNHGKMPWFSW